MSDNFDLMVRNDILDGGGAMNDYLTAVDLQKAIKARDRRLYWIAARSGIRAGAIAGAIVTLIALVVLR